MTGKKSARRRGGWVLAEVLCGVIIVSMLAAQIAESAAMMARVSESGLRRRMLVLDFGSVVSEAERADTSRGLSRGAWRANAVQLPSARGIGGVDISASPEPDETSGTIRWTAWDINGRSR